MEGGASALGWIVAQWQLEGMFPGSGCNYRRALICSRYVDLCTQRSMVGRRAQRREMLRCGGERVQRGPGPAHDRREQPGASRAP